jgi:hypothetical protein
LRQEPVQKHKQFRIRSERKAAAFSLGFLVIEFPVRFSLVAPLKRAFQVKIIHSISYVRGYLEVGQSEDGFQN